MDRFLHETALPRVIPLLQITREYGVQRLSCSGTHRMREEQANRKRKIGAGGEMKTGLNRSWLVTVLLVVVWSAIGCGSGGNGGGDANVSITVTPPSMNVTAQAKAQFSATVSGSSNTGVTWAVTEGASGGSISPAGLYTAPATAGVYHIQATSMANKKATATAQVAVVKAVTSIPHELNAVWGTGAGNIWAVGTGNPSPGVNYHWNGSSWTSTTVPSKYGNYVVNLTSVWGTSPTDVWEVGTSTGLELKHWDGSVWTDFPPNVIATYIFGLWGTGSNDIWAAGSTASSQMYHWDGTAWTGQYLQPTSGASYWMNAAWGSSANDVWAVGGGDDTGQGLRSASMFHWDGTAWTQVLSGLHSALLRIWGTASNNIWTVGENGTLAHWDGTSWTSYDSGTTQDLLGIWGTGANDIWAVGKGGTVLHWDGTAWSPVSVSTTNELDAVWGSGPNDIWIVGNGVILHLPQ